ncbi:coiled-coil domain-containing protein 16 [Caerostris extrusa]|uniref:Coiled-coil domain-containing protein 16 n=1 Tax=Caerostris extrusa TaxID=172846 RepID=A0AAV4WAV3_CAEEX|nr:coiled-coil domain-containing protein 16 [Caerostris extrusa]
MIERRIFDDPVLDATARNIEYKDPVEEEWEKFQKTIVEETNSIVFNNCIMRIGIKTIIADDAEESYRRRDIEEVYEQIQLWQRVNKLELLVDDAKLKATKKDTPKTDVDNDASDSTDDDLDLNDLLDWPYEHFSPPVKQQTTLKRLRSFWIRLSKDQEYLKLFREFMEEHEKLSHMKEVAKETEPDASYYETHHGLYLSRRKTTKLLIAFN